MRKKSLLRRMLLDSQLSGGVSEGNSAFRSSLPSFSPKQKIKNPPTIDDHKDRFNSLRRNACKVLQSDEDQKKRQEQKQESQDEE